ncbi:uncharacterized protein LOC126898446 [Daktulosphaira vitifoliae]|uniref:uncharacterized protein LOC126898446 n=1 Tax=Daktulosphaira vitifoliae TaxID=58002 RepID=UPI0021AA6CB8|nr:uncharacterized protein LOC126898446 [Daktulosphaira vitifoliae]
MGQNLDYVKTIVRSVLTSSPGPITVSQLQKDYYDLEGETIPFKRLNYSTVFKLLNDMKDVLKVPENPNMFSLLYVIANDKTTHLRKLVLNQKRKKIRPKRFVSSKSSFGNHDYSRNNFSPNNNYNGVFNERGYNYIKSYSNSLGSLNGKVTTELQSFLEKECQKNPNGIPLSVFKEVLLKHNDYKYLKTVGVQESINMLKNFIYIERGRVYLKSSNPMLNRSKTVDLNKSNCYQSLFTKDDCEYSEDDINFFEDEYDNDEYEYFKKKPILEPPVTNDEKYENTNNFSAETNSFPEELKGNNYEKLCPSISESDQSRNICSIQTINNSNIDQQMKRNDSKNMLSKTKFKNQLKSTSADIDYKQVIINILSNYQKPVTVQVVLEKFKDLYGYEFPHERLSCRTAMDFFRLHPAHFRLKDQYSTNSIVTLETSGIKPVKRTSTMRHKLLKYTIDKIKPEIISIFFQLRQEVLEDVQNNKSESSIPKSTSLYQSCESVYSRCHSDTASNRSNEEYDSYMIRDSMKEKMRALLAKHKNGINCNDFIYLYDKMYSSSFTFHEYGFKSMSDMAYNIPSVFHVEIEEDTNECILHQASKRDLLSQTELYSVLSYKNIPKSVLYHLSKLFKNIKNGVHINNVKQMYIAEFGRRYESLKYGFSSERHMFEILDKMIKINDDILYTKDPNAYNCYINGNACDSKEENILPALPKDSFFKNLGNDIYNGNFEYSYHTLAKGKQSEVTVAEIYDPSSFYVHSTSYAKDLSLLMDELQKFYNDTSNEDKCKVLPELVTPGLPCISRFEDSMQWHRAVVLKLIDEDNVQLLYVDYGSIENVPKINVRLLEKKFSKMHAQAIHCSLFYKYEGQTFSRETKENFARLVDSKTLWAHTVQKIKSEYGNAQKLIVSLFHEINNQRINIKKEIIKDINVTSNQNQGSIRQQIARLMI